MPRIIGPFALLCLLACLPACVAQVNETREGASPPGTITHVVLVKLKNPKDDAAVTKLADATRSFLSIPGVRHVATGRLTSQPLPPGNAIPAAHVLYDIMIVITFDSPADLQRYRSDPAHTRARQELLAPLADTASIYDALNQ